MFAKLVSNVKSSPQTSFPFDTTSMILSLNFIGLGRTQATGIKAAQISNPNYKFTSTK